MDLHVLVSAGTGVCEEAGVDRDGATGLSLASVKRTEKIPLANSLAQWSDAAHYYGMNNVAKSAG